MTLHDNNYSSTVFTLQLEKYKSANLLCANTRQFYHYL